MLKSLTDLLYLISNWLLAPVLIALLGMFAWTLVLLGGFIKEAWERGRTRACLQRAVDARERSGGPEALAELAGAPGGLPKRVTALIDQRMVSDPRAVRRALAMVEHDVSGVLARHTFITRISPMVGLMATLIPLGPALSELATGNMQALAGNLVVAFTATVAGLLVSGVAYGMGLARRAWYSRDMVDLEAVFAEELEAVPDYAS